MKKSYLVVVDVSSELNEIYGDAAPTPEHVIAATLNSNKRFLHCYSVELAPNSVQPINTEGTPNT